MMPPVSSIPPQAVAMLTFGVDLATVRVMGRLRDAGIRSILLKGGALRSWLYGPDEVRAYWDIDILVRPEQIDSAAAVMRTEGWTDSIYQSPIGHAHHMDPPPDDAPFPLDIHRSFHFVAVPPNRVWDLLSVLAVPIRLAGREIETLDDVGLAVIVVLHYAGHGAAPAKLTDDLERALARAPLETWREATQLAGGLGAAEAFAATLRNVRGGGRVADALGLEIATEPALRLALSRPPPTSRLLLDLRQAGARPAALLRVLVPELLPAPILMHQHYPLARRGRMGLLCAYLLRPFQLAPRLASGWRAAGTAQVRAKEMAGSFSPTEERGRARLARVRLAGEILVTYLRVTRMVRRSDVRAVLGQVRDAVLERLPPTSAAAADAAHLARGTQRVLGHLPGDTRCLKQSLVLSALLARRGVASHVVIAVWGREEDFGAHAWVEAEGHDLLPPGPFEDTRLVEL
jgi:hypothetical protein